VIYALSMQEVLPGKLGEYSEIVTKEALPTYPRIGLNLVASFHGYTGNMNMIYALFSFKDLVEFQKATQAGRQDKAFTAAQVKIAAIAAGQNRVFLEPNAWSPMK
jgi:hypothetical protein